MAMTDQPQRRWLLLAALTAVAAMMAVLLALTLYFADVVSPERQAGMLRLAWASLAALLITVLLAAWALWRLIAWRVRPGEHSKTPYVDAWRLAGKRMQTPPEDPNDDQPPAK